MLKHKITYKDFDGDDVTEEFYFNINKSELIELEVEHKEGMQEYLQRIVKAEDRKTMVAEFKKIILLAYGEKSEDGKRFIKSDDLRTAFSQTAAYDALFMQLTTDAEASAKFIQAVLPQDLDLGEGVKAAAAASTGTTKAIETPNP